MSANNFQIRENHKISHLIIYEKWYNTNVIFRRNDMKNRKRKRIDNKVDFVLLLIFLAIGLYFGIEAILGKLIPLKYILIFLVTVLFLFVGIFLTFKVRNSTFRVFRKVFFIFVI